ncbi:Centromere protein O [Rhynchospora pubera]|uniref:Centromere protein O n=1 Tax=Rhynchospora pubera TaxID=906938 RepID=A0AAV8FSE7_9POAL|nr:Centromere protein O [Rhynchospora pubera]
MAATEKTSSEPIVAPTTSFEQTQTEQFRKRPHGQSTEMVLFKEEDTRLATRLDATRARLTALLERHENLKERLSRDSDKIIFERLQREFEAAKVSHAEEISLDEEQWNDGFIATIREKVHIEADKKALQGQTIVFADQQQSRTAYRIKNKVIYCLDSARIGILYETDFAGEPFESYHCVLESKSFLEKMTVSEHTVPFFLPIKEAETNFLSSNAIKFIDCVGDMLQAYVDRREQVRLVKELYGNQIAELFHSLPYNMIEFVIEDYYCKVTASVRYSELVCTLPSRARVLAWPIHPSKKISSRGENGGTHTSPSPSRLTYAEEALTTMSLPEAYAEIVLNLKRSVRQVSPNVLRD